MDYTSPFQKFKKKKKGKKRKKKPTDYITTLK